jgi:hypothetical protein
MRPLEDLREARGRLAGSITVEMAVGQPSTSRPFIMIRLVGSGSRWARRAALALRHEGVAAQPTIR